MADNGRVSRPCVGCGQVDTAPRDVVALPDGNTAPYHMDCHVMIADCAVCKAVLEGAGGAGNKGLKNEKLLDYLTSERQEEIFVTDNAANDGVVK